MKHWKIYLKYCLTLALTCVVVGGALGAVNMVTEPTISAQKLAAADSSRLLLFPDADKFEPMEVHGQRLHRPQGRTDHRPCGPGHRQRLPGHGGRDLRH